MQTAFNLETVPTQLKKLNYVEPLKLTKRDLEAITFILDMKFASLEEIYAKFFKRLRNVEISKSDWWARDRFSLLVRTKFLSRVHSFYERKSYYQATIKGYLTLARQCPAKLLVRPTEKLDFSPFDHDKLLLALRLKLEESLNITSWISDRQLRCFPELTGGIESLYIPDAVYTNSQNEKIALELEIATKAKDKYREKIKRFVKLLRSQGNNKPFDRVEYVCAKEAVYKFLEQDTKIYGDLFSVKMLNEILPNNK